MYQHNTQQQAATTGTGRISLDKRLVDAWNIVSDNLVLIVPAFLVAVLNIIVYGGLIGLFFLLCVKDISGLNINLSDPTTFPIDRIGAYIMQFLTYIIGFVIIGSVYSFAVKIVHGAGWSNMFACAARNGKTDFGDYMAGIGNFTGRMFGMQMVRTSIMLLPVLLVLVAAVAFAAVGGENSDAPSLVIIIFGGLALFPVIGIISFMLWMWRPAMFVRDMPLMDSMFECIRFTRLRLANLIIFLLLWIAATVAVSTIFSGMNMTFQMIGSGAKDIVSGSIILMIMFAVRFVSGFFLLCMKLYFNAMYFKFYADEYAVEPAPTGMMYRQQNTQPYYHQSLQRQYPGPVSSTGFPAAGPVGQQPAPVSDILSEIEEMSDTDSDTKQSGSTENNKKTDDMPDHDSPESEEEKNGPDKDEGGSHTLPPDFC